ncbi:hypothetical protein CIB84_009763 [Bambusicola thoracicus]|uniref:CD34 molecule n=1 Tax=Bambusicola thoracicus TaxID=9083 RepID=A0A2P4SQV0_BAMTH|nr:hypothetical protein CIB84_009763 [Bambusicola thoracicus]
MALCLKSSQKHFLDTKGSDLWSAICEGDAHHVPSPCHIKLATSEVDQECLLLVLDGNRGQELSPSTHHALGHREGLGRSCYRCAPGVSLGKRGEEQLCWKAAAQTHTFPICKALFGAVLFFQFGIKSLERGSVRSHQDFSRKTLTALVTSGLLLAALGTAGYFLMRRRSWSPAGQRLVSAYRWQSAR